MTKWRVCALVCGVLCLVFGVMLLYGAVNDPDGDTFIMFMIFGILGTAGGICGIAGGRCIDRNNDAARKLLLAAAVILLPYAFLFFFMFMAARNKGANADKAWE